MKKEKVVCALGFMMMRGVWHCYVSIYGIRSIDRTIFMHHCHHMHVSIQLVHIPLITIITLPAFVLCQSILYPVIGSLNEPIGISSSPPPYTDFCCEMRPREVPYLLYASNFREPGSPRFVTFHGEE